MPGRPIADAIVGRWLLHSLGDLAFDCGRFLCHLSLVNTPTWSIGNFGFCLLFNDAAWEFMRVNAAPIIVAPLTLHGWFNCDDATNNGAILWLGDKDVVDQYWVLYVGGGSVGDPVKAIVRDAVANQDVLTTTTGFTVGKWHSGSFVNESETVRRVYIDANSVGIGDGLRYTPANADRTAAGVWDDSTPDNWFSGKLDNLAIYNRGLWLAEEDQLRREPFCEFEDLPSAELLAAA